MMKNLSFFVLWLTLSAWAAPVHDAHAGLAKKRDESRPEFHFLGLNSTAPMFNATRNETVGNMTEYYAKIYSRQTMNETNSTLPYERHHEANGTGEVEVCIHEDASEHVKTDGYCRLGPGTTFGMGPNGVDGQSETSPEYQKMNTIPNGYLHPRRHTNSSSDNHPLLNATDEHSDPKYHPIRQVRRNYTGHSIATPTRPAFTVRNAISNTSEPWKTQHLPKDDDYGSCHIEAPATGHTMPSSMSMYARDCRDLMNELTEKSGFYLISKLYQPLNIASKGSCFFNITRGPGDSSYVKLWRRDVATVLKGLVEGDVEQKNDVTINSAFGAFQCNGTLMQWSVSSPGS